MYRRKRTTRTVRRKKGYRKRRIGTRRRTTRLKRYTAIAPRTFVKLVYSGTAQELALVASTINRQVFRLNGMYDPDLSGAGHQPYYYDQWSSMYYNYRVYGAKVEVRVAMSSGYTKPVYFCLWASDSTVSSITNPDQMVETYGSKLTMLTSDQSSRYVKRYYPIYSIFGIGKQQYSYDPNYAGKLGNVGVGQDPTLVAAVSLMFYSNQASFVNFDTKITYYAMLYNRYSNLVS